MKQRQHFSKFDKDIKNSPHPKNNKSKKRKENKFNICYKWINIENIILSEVSLIPKETYIVWFHLCEVPGAQQFLEDRK